jgi:isopentenyl diphosphate isomerase/L-lactate dehydrogenase-like FMN-dependent dehydrogenase
VAAAANGPLWYQLYGSQKPEDNREVLELAQSVGCQAIVVTVDQQASSYPRSLHDRNLRGYVNPAPAPAAAGPALYGVDPERLWYTWEWLDEIRKFVHVPMLVKGVLTGEDARICADRGLGVIVSNHGGRSLDYDPSTLEVLPEIVEQVRGRVPVLFDSGIRRGSDVLKALALGANAVCVGRVPRWGLGAFGAPGLQRVLEILQAEVVQAAAAAGHASLASIDKSAVRTHFT